MSVSDAVFGNLNTYLVLFLAGLCVWLIRQFTPDSIEDTKIWKVLLRVLPILAGGFISMIPGLRPIADNFTQSVAIGVIGGSFATSVYELLRELVSTKIRDALGSKTDRVRNSKVPSNL